MRLQKIIALSIIQLLLWSASVFAEKDNRQLKHTTELKIQNIEKIDYQLLAFQSLQHYSIIPPAQLKYKYIYTSSQLAEQSRATKEAITEEQKEARLADICSIFDSGKSDEVPPSCEKSTQKKLVKYTLKDPIYNFPVYRNQRINAYIQLFTTRKRRTVSGGFRRSTKYLTMIHRVLKKHNVPLGIAYLALVESSFKSTARSHAKATGMWQFMSRTGRAFKLRQSWWHDERLDPEKSTVAAATYLKKLYKQFGTWELALAAYNSGPGTVRRAIRRNKRKGLKTDYWSLRLPLETRGYVPAFYAVVIISSNLEQFGFDLDLDYQTEIPTKKIRVAGGLSLKQISTVLNIRTEVLHKFNPSIRRGVTPAHFISYKLRVPTKVRVNVKKLNALAKLRAKLWKTHRVRRGDTLWAISRRYRIPIHEIVAFNRKRIRIRILRIGKILRLPVPRYAYSTSKVRKKSDQKKTRSIFRKVKIRSGDSLWAISRRYGVSVKKLLRWNSKLRHRRVLKIGMRIRVQKRSHNNS